MNKLIYTFIYGFLALTACQLKEQTITDSVFHNGYIFTADSGFSVVEAMAIDDGIIVATGNNNDILAAYSGTQQIDLKGKIIYPGFIDAHCHFLGYGLTLSKIDLTQSTSFADVLNRTEQYAKTNKGEWILGRGWNETLWEEKSTPNKIKLDIMFPNTPVFLQRVDGHAALVNQAALDLAGINNQTVISGGKIEMINGRMTGIVIDAAAEKIQAVIPKPNRDQIVEALMMAQKKCLEVGLTTVADAGLDLQEILIIDSLVRNGSMHMRVYAMLNPSEENFNYFLSNGPIKTEHLVVRSIKLYADGSLGSRGAFLKKDYCDQPGTIGLPQQKPEYYDSICKRMFAAGFQVCTHCIGDSANLQMMNIYGKYLKGKNDLRWRIEHAQVVDPADRFLFGKYSIIPSIQPTHATSDMYMAEERLCEARMHSAYAYKSLLAQNEFLALGTDFPVESIDPLGTYFSAVTRKNSKGEPSKGFLMNEALTSEQTILGMTRWAAFANFMDGFTGSLERGKAADFVILNKDLSLENRANGIERLGTYIDGVKQ
jgi:predicted amidohydrolase YtcJ